MIYLVKYFDGLIVTDLDQEPEGIFLEFTQEVKQKFDSFIHPEIVNGELVDIATPGQIELYNQRLVPQEVSAARFWLAVFELWGIKKIDVLTIVDTLQEPTTTRIKIMIEASVFERSNPMLLMVAQIFEKTSQELNEVFTLANQPLNV
jgi:hypothetical protein